MRENMADIGGGIKRLSLNVAVDPDGYISPKGWKMLLERAISEGRIASMETPQKSKKPKTCYYLP